MSTRDGTAAQCSTWPKYRVLCSAAVPSTSCVPVGCFLQSNSRSTARSASLSGLAPGSELSTSIYISNQNHGQRVSTHRCHLGPERQQNKRPGRRRSEEWSARNPDDAPNPQTAAAAVKRCRLGLGGRIRQQARRSSPPVPCSAKRVNRRALGKRRAPCTPLPVTVAFCIINSTRAAQKTRNEIACINQLHQDEQPPLQRASVFCSKLRLRAKTCL